MTSNSLQHVDRVIWLTIGAVGLVDIIAAIVGPFLIAWKILAACAAICGLLAAAGYYYRHIRHEEQIAAAIISITQMLCLAIVIAPLSYIAASAAFPSWDARLLAWDKHLGLDWIAWLRFMEAHPYLHLPLQTAYRTLVAQPFVFIVMLVAARRFLQLRIFMAGTALTLLITIAISAVCPAAGHGPIEGLAKPDHFLPASWLSTPIFDGLRDGSYRHLFTPDAEGIVTFPSYHAAAGLLGIFAMWPVRYVRWIILALNAAMIVATPVDGGHYFVDILAGLILATLCWKAAVWMIAPRQAHETSETIVEAPSIVPDTLGSPAFTPIQNHSRTEVI